MKRVMASAGMLALLAGAGVAEAAPRLESSIVPSVRSVPSGTTATAFGVLVNSGDTPLTNCRPVMTPGTAAITFSYQRANASNQPVGVPNVPASIDAGGSQTFVLSFNISLGQPNGSVIPDIEFRCDGVSAPQRQGVNSFTLSVGGSNSPDIIPIVVTPNPGIAEVTTLGGTAVMAAAAVNIGGDALITVYPSAGLGTFAPYVEATVCETNVQGACLAAPTASLTVPFTTNQTRTFSAFMRQAGADPTLTGTPFMPDVVRAGLQFATATGNGAVCDVQGALRGQSTVAFRSPDPARGTPLVDGFYEFVFDDVATRGRGIGIGYYFSALQRFYLTVAGEAFVAPGALLPAGIGSIDAIMASGPNPSFFADARVLLQSFSLQGAGSVNHSMLMGDTASSRFDFQGRGTAGTGGSPLPPAMDNDFRSLWLPMAEGAVVKADYPGAYTPLAGSNPGLTMTLQAGAAGQPMNFTGSFNATCTVTGKLTPVSDTTTPYMAEMTVAGTGCPTAWPAGVHDGYALLTPPAPAQTVCGTAAPATPRQITFQFSPLLRGARSANPGTVATLKTLIVQR